MYKTVLCHQYEAMGNCTYNTKCRYAHRQDELQPTSNHPLYKTILCRSYDNHGICNYWAKCKFIHELSKKRVPTPEKCHNNLSFWIKYWIKLSKIGSEPKFQPSSKNTVHIYMDYYTFLILKIL